MTSEQLPPRLSVPGALFAELATGGGSREALALLERGERHRRLLLLRTALDRLDGLATPLTAPAENWRRLREAARHAPEPVERLLLAPQTGSWLAHLLRRAHGTAPGPPLWAEAGHLGALAVSAALHAGTEADVLVPLDDGAVHLPGLGTVRLPYAPAGLTVGHLLVDGRGTLTLSSSDATPGAVRCRPVTAPARPGRSTPPDPCWTPLRTLDAGPVTIPLDDLHPYRDLDEPVPPARLDADEAAVWQDLFDEAAALLARAGDGGLDLTLVRAVVPWGRTATMPPAPPHVRVSASSGDSFGAMVIARPGNALALAETFVHEFQHSKLGALLHLLPLLDDDRVERYYAPWRADPRHRTGLLHGAYAFTGVTGFWYGLLGHPTHGEAAAYHFALRRLQTRLVVRTLLTEGGLTAPGRRLVEGLAHSLDGWLRVPVRPDALARARTAAALHRTEWRLRNVLPAPPGAAPRLRTPGGSWPDLRTHALAVPPAAPRTGDEHLAAGNPAGALARYDDDLRLAPDDPHVLAGWIVARATVHPGRTARRLLARPERTRQSLPSR
ncbi:radical SAM protein [Streptomyces sp. SID8379]|uniref:aKG-HExxH-type peptide beta-hydroxylase n=1 Tax=unclassified Streptomyces TaxID=2593676 RepID=UPI000363EE39|nr:MULTISPECIES: HEXXH motif-containing putative peptide modification protein [unclassified Streptomyces]MYW64027.1 radical SAM protein [Streptomyces sp. SID8379]